MKEIVETRKIVFLIFVSLLLLSGVLRAENPSLPVTLNLEVDKKTITVGDPISLTVTIEYDPNIKLEEPDIPSQLKNLASGDSSMGILEESKVESGKKDGREVRIYKFKITFYSTGKMTIPFLYANFRDVQGRAARARSDPLEVEVKSVLDKDAKDIRDIKPPLNINYPWYYYAAGILSVIILALLIWTIANHIKRKRRTPESLKPSRPPHETALEMLDALQRSTLLDEGKIKEYYISLSNIIRRYIEERFGIPTLDRTTFELYQEMKEARIKRDHISLIRNFLENCDKVKFAKFIPDRPDIDADYNSAREIVNLTREEEKM